MSTWLLLTVATAGAWTTFCVLLSSPWLWPLSLQLSPLKPSRSHSCFVLFFKASGPTVSLSWCFMPVEGCSQWNCMFRLPAQLRTQCGDGLSVSGWPLLPFRMILSQQVPQPSDTYSSPEPVHHYPCMLDWRPCSSSWLLALGWAGGAPGCSALGLSYQIFTVFSEEAISSTPPQESFAWVHVLCALSFKFEPLSCWVLVWYPNSRWSGLVLSFVSHSLSFPSFLLPSNMCKPGDYPAALEAAPSTGWPSWLHLSADFAEEQRSQMTLWSHRT
jgi:hypothetical protein